MQISLKWINELVDIETIELDTLIEKLTLGGFEVEEIFEIEINKQKQTVLDISATANRSDSLSIHGIAAEISALLDQPLKKSVYEAKNFIWKQLLEDKIKICPNESGCLMFVSLIIENLNDKTVPLWMKQKLQSSGIAPSNGLADFQDYIMLETGYPFTFYDHSKICSELKSQKFNLEINTANKAQEFLADNNLVYNLESSTSLVYANEKPISIAGIIGAKNFVASASTTSLLIEGSLFNAAKIRQESRKLGLRTERSARYEKSIRTTYLIEAFYRLISLLRIYNPNLICKFHTIQKNVEEILPPIVLRYKKINEILGPVNETNEKVASYISIPTISSYLKRLNFKFSYNETNLIWEVEIPHLRMEDITREIDLIEEIGRLHGFNNFLTTLPKIKKIGKEDLNYQTRKKLTTCLLNLGLNEVIHYSLVNKNTFLENKIQIVNPISSDYSNLRQSLLPNLIKTVQENLKQKNIPIEAFEYGHLFSSGSTAKFNENEYVAGIFGGIKTKISWEDQETLLTWFEAKGKIEQLFNQLNFSVYWKKSSQIKTENILHPYRSAEIYLENGINLGVFGQIHPLLINKLNISSQMYLFEFDMEAIKVQLQRNKLTLSNSYSLYPKIIKDLSFIVDKEITFEKIKELLYWNGTEFLSEINLLDEYQGPSIPKAHTSLCLQLVFQSNDKTLENKKIENIIQTLQALLIQKFDVNIRT